MSFLSPENSVSMIRGTSRTLEVPITDPDGAVLDLTGARVVFSMKESITDPTPLVQKTSDDVAEIEIPAPREGKAFIYLEPADTHNLGIGEYVFDIWVVLSSGRRYAVVGPSTIELQPGVTVIPV